MEWIIAIPALPAVMFALMVVMPRVLRNSMRFVSIAAMTVVFGLSVMATMNAIQAGIHDVFETIWSVSWPLVVVGGNTIELGFSLSAISAATLPMVSFVAWCVQVFSLGYMADDERKGWYYAVVSLFTAAMLSFVLASDLLLAFVSWEIMGLCSYFLIGFWFTEKDPREASQKAFITTRIGDLGFFFALMVIYGQCGTFSLSEVLGSAPLWAGAAAYLAAGGLLLAAVGKSAQIPLHVWLPDAMAGPTPASALIHAATMVAAGVLLVARTMPIFLQAPELLTLTLIIGLITSVVAGFIACVQQDIKKVLAYSTVSQLGLMFCALGVAGVSAALFHLVTHGFFKALLFLGAGFIIHAVGTQDMREMGGLRKKLPITWITFLIGTLALAGVAPLSGFFSKDEIVHVLLAADKPWAAAGVFAASVLTAFYMTRLYFKVFEGKNRGHCHHEHGVAMLAPLSLLALCTLGAGFISVEFAHFMGAHGEWPSVQLIVISCLVAASGIGSAWYIYGRGEKSLDKVLSNCPAEKRSAFYRVCEQKFYFDRINDAVWIAGTKVLANVLAIVDRKGIDGVVNGLASLTKGLGDVSRDLQTGKLQHYQRLTLAAVIVLVVIVALLTKGV